MRALFFSLALVTVLLAPISTATASPITYNFVGHWGFNDPVQDAPDFWSAMATVGVTNATPFTWALTLDPVAPSEVRSQFRLGTLDLTWEGTVTRLAQGGFFVGASLGPAVLGFRPEYVEWNPEVSSGPYPPLTIGSTSQLIIGFNQAACPTLTCAQYRGGDHPTLVSIEQVPEPSMFVMLFAGCITLFGAARARRLRDPLRVSSMKLHRDAHR